MSISPDDIYDNVTADSLEVGDQIIVDGDPIEITEIQDSADPDEVIVMGYSHDSGDTERYSLYADDYYPLWSK